MATITLGKYQGEIPTSREAFATLVESLQALHPGLRETTLLFGLSTDQEVCAAMVREGKFGSLHLLFESLDRPDFRGAGFVKAELPKAKAEILLRAFTPFAEEIDAHPVMKFLRSAINESRLIEVLILNRDAGDESARETYQHVRTTALFDLFNEGALRGSDPLARQALLDAFSILPNRYLTAEGYFLERSEKGAVNVRALGQEAGRTDPCGGIDKFPSLLSVRAARLHRDGNRIVPSAMIRDGVYVGKRNIFMFHAAVNIAAAIGDDNLIDSHASVGSAAQVGNRNKIASFVSLEGVLSPANAQGVTIGDDNFVGTFARIGTGITLGNKNFIGSGVNLSLGTKIRDCRESSTKAGEYITCRDLNADFNGIAITPNNAQREFAGVSIFPGEYIAFENTPEFMARFDGDTRIKAAK